MLIRNAARPIAFGVSFERFEFADAVERSFRSFDNDAANTLKQFLVRFRSFAVISKSGLVQRDQPN
ncbi:MAG: hypothetical protein WKF84_23920 [Pyrinomonadaceae bacterium]